MSDQEIQEQIQSEQEEIIVDQIDDPAYEKDPIKREAMRERTMGMPKSRMNWRKNSTRLLISSGRNKSKPPMVWEEKMERRAQTKEIRAMVHEIVTSENADLAKRRQFLKDKKKRDEVNKYKTAAVQLISDSKKVKKWNRRLRGSLIKLPAELYEQLLKKKTMQGG